MMPNLEDPTDLFFFYIENVQFDQHKYNILLTNLFNFSLKNKMLNLTTETH